MNTGDLRISRWVMLVETLGCFGMLSLAWFLTLFGPAGLVHYDQRLIDTVFLGQPGGAYLFGTFVVGAVVNLLGPIGLFLGLRYVLSGRALANPTLGYGLIGIKTLNFLAGVVGYFLWPDIFGNADPGLFVLLFVMPVACIAHLMVLARPAPPAAPLGGSPALA